MGIAQKWYNFMRTTSQNEVGWIPSKTLQDINKPIPLDEKGDPTQIAIPLIKDSKPDGIGWKDYLSWGSDAVYRLWQKGEPTPEELRKVWRDGEAFLDSFTLQEQAMISLSNNPTIAALRLKMCARRSPIWSDDPLTQMGITALIEQGIITNERAEQIMGK